MKVTSVKEMPYTRDNDRHPMYKKMRIHFSFSESILENIANRRSRPINELRKLIPEVLDRAGVHPLAIDTCVQQTRWSQKAGCSCGCSPGFIVNNLAGRQLFVGVE